MILLPIPTTPEYLNASFPLWAPFLPGIAQRSPWSVNDLLGKISRGEVQPVLLTDDEGLPIALLGICLVGDGGELVAEIVWFTFKGQQDWRPVRLQLLLDLETYLRDHLKCVKCRPFALPGWKRFLERHGYKHVGTTDDRHVIMEKVL